MVVVTLIGCCRLNSLRPNASQFLQFHTRFATLTAHQLIKNDHIHHISERIDEFRVNLILTMLSLEQSSANLLKVVVCFRHSNARHLHLVPQLFWTFLCVYAERYQLCWPFSTRCLLSQPPANEHFTPTVAPSTPNGPMHYIKTTLTKWRDLQSQCRI